MDNVTNSSFRTSFESNNITHNFPNYRKRRELLLKLIHQQTNAADQRIILDDQQLQAELLQIPVSNLLHRTGSRNRNIQAYNGDRFPSSKTEFHQAPSEQFILANDGNGNFVCSTPHNNDQNIEDTSDEEVHTLEWTARFNLHQDLVECRKRYVQTIKDFKVPPSVASSQTLTDMEEGRQAEQSSELKTMSVDIVKELLKHKNGSRDALNLASRIQQNRWFPSSEKTCSILSVMLSRWCKNYEARFFTIRDLFIVTAASTVILGKYVLSPLIEFVFNPVDQIVWPWEMFTKVPFFNGYVYSYFDAYNDDKE